MQVFSPSSLAEYWGVGKYHILGLIARGDLRAVNVSLEGIKSKRAVYRITQAEVERFEQARATAPAPRKPRRSRKSEAAGTFY